MAGVILQALLSHSIDYAGLFPPASLPIESALAEYREHRSGEYAWMLNRFVVSETDLEHIPHDLDGHLAVLADGDTPRASVIETKRSVQSVLPAYCEVPVDQLPLVSQHLKFAKIRTGGTTPDNTPSTASLAAFIYACARMRLPFKATAGLHHPIRAQMHGFINLLVAATCAWSGCSPATIAEILDERDASAFVFNNEDLRWRNQVLALEDIIPARSAFFHSFGSCSFSEPVADLEHLGWL